MTLAELGWRVRKTETQGYHSLGRWAHLSLHLFDLSLGDALQDAVHLRHLLLWHHN